MDIAASPEELEVSFLLFCMVSFLTSLHSYSDWGLLVLRLAVGIIFLWHCKGKLNGSMGGFMTFIGVCELLGGLALIAGFLTQVAAAGLAIIMLGAAHKKMTVWHVPFSAMDKMGWEFDLSLFAANVLLIMTGAGTFALDPSMFGL